MLLDRYGGVGCLRQVPRRDHQSEPALLHHARDAGARAGLHRCRRRDPPPEGRCPSRPGTGCSVASSPPPDRPDAVVLLDYLTHQRRLLPAVARAYALGFAENELTAALVRVQGGGEYTERDQRELETRAAGLKAIPPASPTTPSESCREACGGAGLSFRERAGRVAGRRRHLRNVRGRQHRLDAARRQGTPHRVQAGVGRP